jgi:hypothetical protein
MHAPTVADPQTVFGPCYLQQLAIKAYAIDEAHSHMFTDQQQSDINTMKTGVAILLWTTAHQRTAVPIQKGEKHRMSPVWWRGWAAIML